MPEITIPTEQWAQIIEGAGASPTYKKIAVPQPGPDEVLVHIRYSGVCHTDLHAMKGDWPLERKMPLIGGHEGAGIVVARGALVRDVQLGDAVGIKWLNRSCLTCAFCLAGDEAECPAATLSGYTVDGTFQQYAVAHAAHVTPLPPDCDLAKVAPLLCAGLTVYRALRESGARAGQHVAIVGAGGGLGSLAVQFAVAMGLRAIAIDGGAKKRDHCRKLGADSYIDYTTTSNDAELVAAVRQATPGGFGPHAAIVIAAAEKPFSQATQYIRARGAIVCVGLPPGVVIRAPVFDLVVRMVSIKGSYVGNRMDALEVIEFFKSGRVDAPINILPLSKLLDVFALMESGEVVGRYVLDTSN